MSRNRLRLLAGIALGASLSAPGAAHANPKGQTYAVTVQTSAGTSFQDCYSFDATQTLTIASYGEMFYGYKDFASGSSKWEAVSRLDTALQAGFPMEFDGKAGPHGDFSGSGSDDAGNTFVLSGSVVASCGGCLRCTRSTRGSAYRAR